MMDFQCGSATMRVNQIEPQLHGAGGFTGMSET